MTETKNEDGSVMLSMKIDEMTVEQLVQLSQAIGHDIERLREKRIYLKAKIDARLLVEQREALQKELEAKLAGLGVARVDGVAEGAVFETSSKMIDSGS